MSAVTGRAPCGGTCTLVEETSAIGEAVVDAHRGQQRGERRVGEELLVRGRIADAPYMKPGRYGTKRDTTYSRSPMRREETMWPSTCARQTDAGSAVAEVSKISMLVTPRVHPVG